MAHRPARLGSIGRAKNSIRSGPSEVANPPSESIAIVGWLSASANGRGRSTSGPRGQQDPVGRRRGLKSGRGRSERDRAQRLAVGERPQALDPLSPGALDPREHRLARAPARDRQHLAVVGLDLLQRALGPAAVDLAALEQLVGRGGEHRAEPAEQRSCLAGRVEGRQAPVDPDERAVVIAGVAQDEARAGRVGERVGVQLIELRRVGGVVLDHRQRVPVEPVGPGQPDLPGAGVDRLVADPLEDPGVDGVGRGHRGARRVGGFVALARDDEVAELLDREPRLEGRVEALVGGREVDDRDQGDRADRDRPPGAAPQRGQPDDREHPEDGSDVAGVVTHEPVLEQREREHRDQDGDRDPRREPLPGAGREDGDEGRPDDQQGGGPVPVDRAVFDLHPALVAGDHLDRGADVIVEIADPLAGGEPEDRKADRKRRRDAAEVAQPRTFEREGRDHHHREHRDPDVELDHRLDRRQRTTAVDEQACRPCRRLALECDEAPEDGERERHRAHRPRHDRRDDQRNRGRGRPREAAPRRPQQARGERGAQPEQVHGAQRRLQAVDHHRLLEEAEWPVGERELGAVVEPRVGGQIEAEDPRCVEPEGRNDLDVVPREQRDDDPEQAGHPGAVQPCQQAPMYSEGLRWRAR